NRIPLAMRCLLLRGHGRTILVDTGVGHTNDERFADIYGIDHDHATLTGSLDALGVTPSEVTDVLLTHLHFDHGGGVTRRSESGDLTLTFPEAAHWVSRSHWDWTRESPREQASFLDENLAPLADSRQLALHDGQSPFPNITFEMVDGHTRGQVLPRITDGHRSLWFAADLIPTAAHVPLLWIMAYDVDPLDTLREKADLLKRAVDEEWLVLFEHDPVNACAFVVETDRGFAVRDERPDLPTTWPVHPEPGDTL
ncbi:MAG: MBL fold metallo-hydrolase, partial [Bacteroidota bacterium]